MCKKPKISKCQLRSYTTPVPIKTTISSSELNNSLTAILLSRFWRQIERVDVNGNIQMYPRYIQSFT
jgi:hypothetical protein